MAGTKRNNENENDSAHRFPGSSSRSAKKPIHNKETQNGPSNSSYYVIKNVISGNLSVANCGGKDDEYIRNLCNHAQVLRKFDSIEKATDYISDYSSITEWAQKNGTYTIANTTTEQPDTVVKYVRVKGSKARLVLSYYEFGESKVVGCIVRFEKSNGKTEWKLKNDIVASIMRSVNSSACQYKNVFGHSSYDSARVFTESDSPHATRAPDGVNGMYPRTGLILELDHPEQKGVEEAVYRLACKIKCLVTHNWFQAEYLKTLKCRGFTSLYDLAVGDASRIWFDLQNLSSVVKKISDIRTHLTSEDIKSIPRQKEREK